MPTDVKTYEEALSWAHEVGGNQHALLGNGFSMAYNPALFGYAALVQRAEDHSLLSDEVAGLMAAMGTPDFEATMRALDNAIRTLDALDASGHSATITKLEAAVVEVREALAQSVAGLHPDRPHEISEGRYRSVRRFLRPFKNIYTVNYDLLLYWALMQEVPDGEFTHPGRAHDDGFRDSRVDGDTTVLWDVYDPFKQSVYYLHGALHLYIGADGLRKLTWVRTEEALIEQTREQLVLHRFPLYVAESESLRKLDRINRSAYLGRGLRSLTSIGGSMVIFGHSLDQNDDHVLEAVVRSKTERLAIALYGDPGSEDNKRIAAAAEDLRRRRTLADSARALDIAYFDASSANLWVEC